MFVQYALQLLYEGEVTSPRSWMLNEYSTKDTWGGELGGVISIEIEKGEGKVNLLWPVIGDVHIV